MIPEKLRGDLLHQHYKVVGNHSAVKLCSWTKKSLRGLGVCYKERFYGIKSHGCLQMSPYIACNNNCLFCWRVIERTKLPLKGDDEPRDIIRGAIEAQRSLLTGFGGLGELDRKKYKEAQNPTNAAISLIGEPTLYQKLPELIEEFRKMGIVTFLVSNGQYPEMLERVSPDQMYISLDAPDRMTYRKLDRPGLKDFWERMGRSLDVMASSKSRKVVRLTAVKGWNMKSPEKYARLIERSNADFVEVKGYMHVGESQKRLPREAMPLHEEVGGFAKEISKETGYHIRDEQKASRVVLLSRGKP
jgi:tRNA wybutosine-synthesizing protein 1